MPDDDTSEQEGSEQEGSPWRSRALDVLKVAAFVAVIWFLVIPQFGEAREAIDAVADVNLLLIAIALVVQFSAYVAHAQLVRGILPAETRPGLARMLGIEFAGRAASHTIPAGTAAGAALSFRLLQRSGPSAADAGFASATQAIGSALVLHALTWGALAVSIPLRGFQSLYGVAAIVGGLLVLGAIALVLAVTRWGTGTADAMGSLVGRVPLVDDDKVRDAVERVSERVRWFIGDRRIMARSAGWSLLHWSCDAASLWLFLTAVGLDVPIDVVLVAFGIASMVATIPISPRGLGFVEASLITLLAGFDLDRGAVVLGVIGYRLASFWLPIPLGGISYVVLELTTRGSHDDAADDEGSEPDASETEGAR